MALELIILIINLELIIMIKSNNLYYNIYRIKSYQYINEISKLTLFYLKLKLLEDELCLDLRKNLNLQITKIIIFIFKILTMIKSTKHNEIFNK